MSGKFNFRSGKIWISVVLAPIIIMLGSYLGVHLADTVGVHGLLTLFILISFIPALGFVTLMGRVPCSFSADDNAVTFKVFLNKRVIPYTDIKDIEVSNEYVDPLAQRERPYYREDIRFITTAGDICYHRRMNIDMYIIAEDPSALKRQLDDGDFNKLRKFIMARKAKSREG